MASDKSGIWLSSFHAGKDAFSNRLFTFHIFKHKVVLPFAELLGSKSRLPQILLLKVINHLLSLASVGLHRAGMDSRSG